LGGLWHYLCGSGLSGDQPTVAPAAFYPSATGPSAETCRSFLIYFRRIYLSAWLPIYASRPSTALVPDFVYRALLQSGRGPDDLRTAGKHQSLLSPGKNSHRRGTA